jgi:hypothetical protein
MPWSVPDIRVPDKASGPNHSPVYAGSEASPESAYTGVLRPCELTQTVGSHHAWLLPPLHK